MFDNEKLLGWTIFNRRKNICLLVPIFIQIHKRNIQPHQIWNINYIIVKIFCKYNTKIFLYDLSLAINKY